MFGSSENGPEVRDYVYLDAGSLDSWYASMYGWVPESRQQQEGREYTGEGGVGGTAEAAIPLLDWLGKLGIDGNLGGSITGQRMTETADRVIDQGLHTQLREELDSEDMIKPITSDVEPGDVVEVTGEGTTDPLYRLILALQRLIAVDDLKTISNRLEELQPEDNTEDGPRDGFRPGTKDPFGEAAADNSGGLFGGGGNWLEQMADLGQGTGNEFMQSRSDAIGEELQQALNVIYGDDICLMLNVDEEENENTDGTYPQCGMLLSEDNLRTEPREFLSEKKYTVLGRVVETNKDGSWNYAELLRVAETVLDDDDIDELRETFEESMEDMNSSEDVSVDSGAFTTDDSVVVIKPVAVYW
ncbi:hypothetical protein ACFPYI_11060 [Halomarina salina]|uniref:Uncharacterized protein n=1 Tax=Halomarina salina TaxID=1872699 RepID=A0ABD5RMK8_9EURY|nr:hypothetical protein [Halomarina salina]